MNRDDGRGSTGERRFSEAIQVVHSSQGRTAESEVVADAAAVSTPFTRRSRLRKVRQIARRAAVRRRRVTVLVVLANIAVVAVCALGYLPWFSVAVGAGVLIVDLLAARVLTILLHRKLDAEVSRLSSASAEDTMVLAAVLVSEEGEHEHSVELSVPVHEMMGSLWDPIPVSAPTYVSSPLAPRTVRTIDLSAPLPVSQPVPPVAAEHSLELPRAVGE